ncbi:MAG: hypothetical protein IPK77_03190 [Cellvibrio sp.]|nr:hypothetical protein [Cellvibrio sp.]
MHKKILMLIVLLSAVGCSTVPVLNQQPILADVNKAKQFWSGDYSPENIQIQNAKGECKVMDALPIDPDNDAQISYSFLIDSKGRVFERRFHSPSSGSGINLYMMNQLLVGIFPPEKIYFQPTSTNTQLTPARVTQKLYLVPCH